jgi:hypothetical protein
VNHVIHEDIDGDLFRGMFLLSESSVIKVTDYLPGTFVYTRAVRPFTEQRLNNVRVTSLPSAGRVPEQWLLLRIALCATLHHEPLQLQLHDMKCSRNY